MIILHVSLDEECSLHWTCWNKVLRYVKNIRTSEDEKDVRRQARIEEFDLELFYQKSENLE